ncbi:MAG: hypothetical protein R3B68_08060 [Phycisphaerales bacterium]
MNHPVGQTFSDTWYRVAPLRAKVSPHAHVIRQKFGDSTAYIVEDPVSGDYYRCSEAAIHFLGMLDGRATVDDAWKACATQLGDDAPTQKECIDLLSKLQNFGLLVGEQPLAADMVEARIEEVERTRRKQRAGKWFFFSIPLLNPDRFLRATLHLYRPLFSRWGLAAWVLLVGVALWHLASNSRGFVDEFGTILDPANLLWFTGLFLVLRAVHEFGHAMACRALGGRCTEIGLLMIAVVLPLPYCDASSAWRFPEVWRRVVVSAGGVLAESVFAAIAAIIWARTEAGTLAHALSYNTVIASGIATLVFNLNPLLRYDGYYILSDITGIPNLAQRSRDMAKHLLERYAFGVRGIDPPHTRGRGERAILLVYSLLSMPYRVLVMGMIVWVLLTTVPWVGVPLAIVGGFIVLVLPLAVGVSYLLTSPRLMGRRARAVSISAAVVGAVVVGLGVAPAPSGVFAIATVEPARRGPIRTLEEGRVVATHVVPGALVRAGDPILTLESAELTAEIEATRAMRDQALAAIDAAMGPRPAEAAVARQRLAFIEGELERLDRRAADLVVRAPIDGRLVTAGDMGATLDNLLGRTLARGALIAFVVSDELILQASVSDRDFAYAFRERRAEDTGATFRIRGLADQEIPAAVTRVDAAGSRILASPALAAAAGGDVLLDPTDPDGRRTLEAQFLVELAPDRLPEGVMPGVRARVRFDAGTDPLLSQWWRRLRQRVTDRLGV